MDIPNTIIGVILLITLIAPIVVINKRISNKRKQFLNQINEFASEDQKEVIEFETWTNNSIIGISNDNKMLYFIRNTSNYNLKTKVVVSEIKNCFIKENKEFQKINSLELVFELKSNKSNVVLEFFKADEKNFMIGEEMRIAKSWQSKLSEEITHGKILFI